jgi:hypothetical protein
MFGLCFGFRWLLGRAAVPARVPTRNWHSDRETEFGLVDLPV